MVKRRSRRVVVGIVGVLMLVLSLAGATAVGAQSTTPGAATGVSTTTSTASSTGVNTYGCAVNDYKCFYYVGSNGMYPYINNTTYNPTYLYGYYGYGNGYGYGYGYGYPGYTNTSYAYSPYTYGYASGGYPPNSVASTYFDPRYCGNGAVSVVTDQGGALIDVCTSTGQRILPIYPDFGYGYGYFPYYGR